MEAVTLVLCLIVYCSAQTPIPCKSPLQWEGRIYRIKTKEDQISGATNYRKVSYDEENKRIRIISDVEVGSDIDYFDTLYLYNIDREYRLNMKTNQCNVTSMTQPFRSFGVPPVAKFLFEAEIGNAGVPGESLTAQTFEGEFKDKSRCVVSVTYPDCVPISSTFTSNDSSVVQLTFFDVKVGISDPAAFVPSAECK